MQDQRVLVIGGSSGIGFEIARQAGERGAQLIITGRDRDKLAAAAADLQNVVRTMVVDDLCGQPEYRSPGARTGRGARAANSSECRSPDFHG